MKKINTYNNFIIYSLLTIVNFYIQIFIPNNCIHAQIYNNLQNQYINDPFNNTTNLYNQSNTNQQTLQTNATNPQNLNTIFSQLLTQAKSSISEGKLSEAKEILRTLIRLEPYNIEVWNLYDNVIESIYIKKEREEKRNPVIERDLKPTFSLSNIESYEEYNTIYIIGNIKNLSSETRYNIVLEVTLLDENKQEIRKEIGNLYLRGRGLFAGETSIFEIPIKNPPPGIKSFKVRVASYD